MQIKQLELFGFKSFVDKAVISFATGIFAVVGPNGCGKSNIVDAIRWVLGEQSAKQLRGKSMEEVIFSGANGRPSLNFAEVSLVLSNEDGRAPSPYNNYSEIMVTRRLFRSGDSEYLINKTPCRRMDISRLFMDTGIGHRHYAIIEQGKISQVVESKPDDIRALIEEAAGITKFKIKKKAALRKIELTRQNLLRLGDIIAEVSRQVSSLKRQANRASRYRTLKKEIKTLEITRALHHYQTWRNELELLERNLNTSKDAQAERAAQLAGLDAEITDRSSRMHQLEERLQQQREELFQIKNTIGNDENSLFHLQRQIQELQDRNNRLGQEIKEQGERQQQLAREKKRIANEQEELADACSQSELLSKKVNADLRREKERHRQLHDELDGVKADLVDLLGEMARVRNLHSSTSKRFEELDRRRDRRQSEYDELQALQDQLKPQRQRLENDSISIRTDSEKLVTEANNLHEKSSQLEQVLAECKNATNSLESTCHQQQSQLGVLLEMEGSYAWFNDAVKELMNAKGEGNSHFKIQGAVAEMVEVDSTYRPAVEAVLGSRLQAIVVDSVTDALDALQHLKRTRAGRNHLIPQSIVRNTPEPAPGGAGPVPLASLVKPHPGHEPVINFLLSKVMFCCDLDQALDWWHSHPHDFIVVTAEGDLVAQDGTFWGGSQEKQISILEKREERKSLEIELAKLDQTLKKERAKSRKTEAELAQVTSRLQSIEENQQRFRDQLLQQEKERYRLDTEQQRINDRFAILDMEKDHDEEEVSRLELDRRQYKLELQNLELRRHELETILDEAQQHRQELENQIDMLQEKTTARQVSVTALAEKQEAARANHLRLKEYYAEVEGRLHQLKEENESCQLQIRNLVEEQRETQARLEQAHQNLIEKEKRLRSEEDHWRKFETRQHELEERRLKLLQQDKEQEQEIQSLRQEITELNLKIQYLIHQTQEHYHLDLSLETPPEPEETLDLDRMEQKLQRLRDRVARIGEVNLTAIEEYEEQRQRHDFLAAQRDDLVRSLEGLRKAITRINRTTRNRFLKTLDAVNQKLAEVFPLLFNGGSGHLKLLTNHDPLDAGVEILVHPPGKRLISMSLLSGGEKALAAAALLFSLYMIRPSPFCILDEVDAPLDDANIDRFIKVLKRISQDSQIIMVTHNKRTMEISDALLGVTMEQPGISKIISVDFQGGPDTHGQMVQAT